MKQPVEFKFPVVDHAEEVRYNEQAGFMPEKHAVTVRPDDYGCSIEIEGSDQSIVLDLEGGLLRVFITNEHGDIPSGGPRLVMPVRAAVNQG